MIYRLSIIFIALLQLNVYAQYDLKFVRYTTNEGLAHNYVRCIHQDEDGFLWFGTKGGICRFDGLNFKTWKNEISKPNVIGSGWITRILQDNKDRLWISITGSDKSLMLFNKQKQAFEDKSQFIKDSLNLPSEFPLSGPCADSKGYIWLASIYGIIKYQPDSNKLYQFFDYKNAPKKITSSTLTVKEIVEHNGNIWIATTIGLFKYSVKQDTFFKYLHVPNNNHTISSSNCHCLYVDNDNSLWIGTYNGLNKVVEVSPDSVIFTHYFNEIGNESSISNNIIYDITEDKKNNLIIATLSGLNLMDKSSGKIYRMYYDEINDNSINSDLVRTAFCDSSGTIWIGTDSGIGKSQHKNFNSYTSSTYINSIANKNIVSFAEGLNGDIWIATPKGIDVLNRKTSKFNHFIEVSRNSVGLYGTPLSMLYQKDKGMWIGTWYGGISYYDFKTKKLKNYLYDASQLSNKIGFCLYQDKSNNLWVGGYVEGLFLYSQNNELLKRFSHQTNNPNSLSSNLVNSIFQDSDSDIWVANNMGLDLLVNLEEGKFKRFIQSQDVRKVIERKDKKFWLATSVGLYEFNKNGPRKKLYTVNNGLPGNNIMGMLMDNEQNLWISTTNSFAKFIPGDNNSEPKVIVFKQEEGLDIGSFKVIADKKLFDGTMLFGGTNGFCMFKPSEVTIDSTPPVPFFTQLKVNNQIVHPGHSLNNQIILRNSIELTKQISLNNKNNNFSIEFSGLHYNMPQYNTYAYTLSGYDNKMDPWHKTDASDRVAEYMNLPSGNYIFKVKVANSYGVWSKYMAELHIKILPPWWQSIWLKFSLVFIIVLSFILLYQQRTHHLKGQKIKLENLVNKRTQELLDVNQKLENQKMETELMSQKLHDADQWKLRFFTNISHEFRTPLTLIISPLQKYVKISKLKHANEWENIHQNLQLVLRNAQRLLRLVNQIIDIRKLDQNVKELKLSNNNIIEFVHDIINAFQPHAETKNININLKFENLNDAKNITIQDEVTEISDFWFDHDIMDKVLFNLISNALKYSPDGGNILITIAVQTQNISSLQNQMVIKIIDTGIGINPENLDKIFDRFYRVIKNEQQTIEGAGIGLALTKELVELHRGTISVNSVLGEGTTFTLSFPFIKIENTKPQNIKSDVSKILTQSVEAKKNILDVSADDKILGHQLKSSKKVLLIVEDNTDMRDFMAKEFERDYNVFTAENGADGLKTAKDIAPDLIISDVMMPEMDGIEFTKRVKQDESISHVPIILLTAKTGNDNMLSGLKTGADDYITKPFDIEVLKTKISNILHSRDQLRKRFNSAMDILPRDVVTTPTDEKFLENAIKIVEENISNIEFSNDQFIKLSGKGRTIVYEKIKKLTGLSVSSFIRNIRLKKAAKLLLEGDKNVNEIAIIVGYKYRENFTAHFKAMFGKSPTQFIKERKN